MRKLILFAALLAAPLFGQTASYPTSVATNQQLAVGKDRSASTLSSGIDNVTLTVPVADGTQFVANEIITIDSEQMQIQTVVSNTLTVYGRGFNGTAAASHSSGASVRGNITSWHHNALRVELQGVENAIPPSVFTTGGILFASSASALGVDTTNFNYNSTTHALTATGGFVGPSFTGTGSTAGKISLGQGTAPSFPANSFSLYSPTAITTSYGWKVPAADPTDGFVKLTADVLSTGFPSFDQITTGTATTATHTYSTGSTLNTSGTAVVDFGTSGHTRPATTGLASAKPATCTTGDMFFATDATAGQNWYYCTATNTWTQQLNSGGAPGAPVRSISFTSITSATLVHNLDTTDVIVTCYDAGSPAQVIVPSSLSIPDGNSISVTFASAQSGKCVVMAAAVATSFTAQTSVTLTHNLSTTDILAACYDTSSNQIGWNSLALTSSSSATVTFASAQSGKCVVAKGIALPFTSVTTVALAHYLGTTDLAAMCYDAGSPASQIGYNSFSLTDTNTVTATFTAAQSGKCVIATGGTGNVLGGPSIFSGPITSYGTIHAVRNISTAATAATTDYTFICDTSAAGFTLTLPASPETGRIYVAKKTSSLNTLTIDGNGHNIDGAATLALTALDADTMVQYDGTAWWIIN